MGKEVAGDEAASAVGAAAEELLEQLGFAPGALQPWLGRWKSRQSVERPHLSDGSAEPDPILRRLLWKGEPGRTGSDAASRVFLVQLAIWRCGTSGSAIGLREIAEWRAVWVALPFGVGVSRDREAVMADHLFWWLLRRRNSSAWTWLAYLASVEAASDLVRHPIGTVARTLTRDELAGEMVAWVLEQQNQEETQEMELGKTDGSLAGRLGFQPARASFEAWLHAVALQQARRRVNRRVGLAPEEVGVETGSGWVEGEGDAPGQVPPALRSDERDVPHLLTGLDESQWEAGAGSVTDGYLSAAELGAFRFAATVNWDRTANDGLNTEAFAWSLFGSAQSPDATKRMQAAAARFYLWLLLKDGMTGRVRRQLTEAVEEGWLDEEQAWSETNGLSSYLSNAGARTRHLERGGATYGIHNRLQFAIYNLCAAATLGASDTRDAMRLISGEGRALVEWASKRCGVSTDVLDLARAGDPVRAFGPAGRDHVVTKRSVWDMLRVQRDLTSLASALRVYAAVSENRLWVKGTEALREYAPDRGDVVRLRARLREAHRSHPEVLPSIAAKYWLHDPASAERDRLRRLVTAAHSTPSAAVMLYESATEHSRSTGWHVLDGAPLIKLLLMKEA